jgi:hydrogenase large subunit
MAVAHYLQALEVQRYANKIVATLGSKTPHIQNLAVGGVSNPISTDSQSVLTIERLLLIKEMMDKLGSFIRNCYQVDVAAVGAFYSDWTAIGAGVTDYLSVPDMPTDTKCTKFMTPGGFIKGGDLATYKPITSYSDPYFRDGVAESVKHSWYNYSAGAGALHPWKGETTPAYTDFQDNGKYSWVKSPTFYGKPAQVGPLANVLCGVAAGHQPTISHLNRVVDTVSQLSGTKIPLTALHSTIGRHAARAVRCGVVYESLQANWQALMENIAKGDVTTFNKPVFPKGEIMGVGLHEAPRGLLSHWSVIKDGKIANYQAVVPTTWLAAPRNEDDQIGPYEASLLNTPVADPERPLEVLRTIHSFDPCLACAVHLTDKETKTVVQVKVL